jgi:hypothetical protein
LEYSEDRDNILEYGDREHIGIVIYDRDNIVVIELIDLKEGGNKYDELKYSDDRDNILEYSEDRDNILEYSDDRDNILEYSDL